MTEPDIKTALLTLPAEIAASATSVLNLQISKIDLETRCSEIKELERKIEESNAPKINYSEERIGNFFQK